SIKIDNNLIRRGKEARSRPNMALVSTQCCLQPATKTAAQHRITSTSASHQHCSAAVHNQYFSSTKWCILGHIICMHAPLSVPCRHCQPYRNEPRKSSQ